MRLVRAFEDLPPSLKGGALAIGNFDGLHLGHRAVLEEMLDCAEKQHATPAVMTFEPHPRMFFSPGHAPHRIEPLHRKLRRLRQCGVKIVYLMRFNEALSSLSADCFVNEILSEKLGVTQVITGEEFVFGYRRGGHSGTLRQAAERGRFGYRSVPPVMMEGKVCSSSRIRAHLGAGEMEAAAALLGRPYEITGRVRHGHARGRELGAPTANLGLHELFLPRYGVYAVRYRISEGAMLEEGREWRDGVANLGVRPTFGENEAGLEVHGFGESRPLYGLRLRVQLRSFLREEKAFPSPEALREQIGQDIARAKEVLAAC